MQLATSSAAQSTAPGDGTLLAAPGVVTAVRSLYVVVGALGAAIAFVCTGFVAAIADCSGDATGLCTNYAGLVPVLEWALVLAAFAAPLAGGIVACIRREWPWLVVGLFAAAVMFALTVVVARGPDRAAVVSESAAQYSAPRRRARARSHAMRRRRSRALIACRAASAAVSPAHRCGSRERHRACEATGSAARVAASSPIAVSSSRARRAGFVMRPRGATVTRGLIAGVTRRRRRARPSHGSSCSRSVDRCSAALGPVRRSRARRSGAAGGLTLRRAARASRRRAR